MRSRPDGSPWKAGVSAASAHSRNTPAAMATRILGVGLNMAAILMNAAPPSEASRLQNIVGVRAVIAAERALYILGVHRRPYSGLPRELGRRGRIARYDLRARPVRCAKGSAPQRPSDGKRRQHGRRRQRHPPAREPGSVGMAAARRRRLQTPRDEAHVGFERAVASGATQAALQMRQLVGATLAHKTL